MKQRKFLLLLLVISAIGLILRLIDYDRVPPWRESDDEIHFAWAGMTLIKQGVPKSWSWLESYPKSEKYRAWGIDWRIVSPMMEKPPLYLLINGIVVLLSGATQLSDVRLSVIRLIPIILGTITIFLTGILAKIIFSHYIGLLAALLYAIIPTVVLSNRLSQTENLITPLSLISLILIYSLLQTGKNQIIKIFLIGIVAGLAFLTKQIGITVLISAVLVFAKLKKWQNVFLVILVALPVILIYPFEGFVYDWSLFKLIFRELRIIGLQGGLPQLVYTIVSRPLIASERLFLDGTMLIGFFLLILSPWWFLDKFKENNLNKKILLSFPFTYFIYLSIIITAAEPMGSGQSFWGWYVYPLFPYLIIFISLVFMNLWRNFSIFKLSILTLILGSSTIRFLLIFLPRQFHYRWQYLLIGLYLMGIGIWILKNNKLNKIIMIAFFLLYLGVNIYTTINMARIYPALKQPIP